MIVNNRRYCKVTKCRSGLAVEKEKRKKLGLCQLSVFRVPRDLTLREKWSQILGQTFVDTDSVCELHFPLDLIEKYYNTRLPNGTVQKIQREKPRLKKNALPMQEKREPVEENDNSIDKSEPNYLKLEIAGSHSLIVVDRKMKECGVRKSREDQINELLCLSEENIGLQETIGFSGEKIIDLTDPDFNHKLKNNFESNTTTVIQSAKSPNTDGSNKSTYCEIPIILTKPLDDHCYFFKSNEIENIKPQNADNRASSLVESGSLLIKQYEEAKNNHVHHEVKEKIPHLVKSATTSQLNSKDFKSKKVLPIINTPVLQEKLLQKPTVISNVPVSQKVVLKDSNPITSQPVLQKNQTQQHCKKRKIESVECTKVLDEQPFNLNAIREYFVKNPLPKSWTWIENKRFDAVIFIQISRATQHIRCYIECKQDLSIHVSTFDRHEIKQLDCVVTSIDDVLKLLMKVYNLRLCEATAVNETRSAKCSLVLTEEESRKRKLPVDRCSNCRTNEKKSKVSKILNLPKIRIDVNKNHELSQKLHQATRSSEYYREKCENMKKMVENLKKACITSQNTAKKLALDEAISQLPSLQQEVVRSCFDNANVDLKGRRYEANYAYECFLLQAVSDAAYDHIRQRNLLPLPCKSTLHAVVGGQTKT